MACPLRVPARRPPREAWLLRTGSIGSTGLASNLQSHSARLSRAAEDVHLLRGKEGLDPRQERGSWLPDCPPLGIQKAGHVRSFSSSEGYCIAPAASHSVKAKLSISGLILSQNWGVLSLLWVSLETLLCFGSPVQTRPFGNGLVAPPEGCLASGTPPPADADQMWQEDSSWHGPRPPFSRL